MTPPEEDLEPGGDEEPENEDPPIENPPEDDE